MAIQTPEQAIPINQFTPEQLAYFKDTLQLTGLDIFELTDETTKFTADIELNDGLNYKFTCDSILTDLDLIEDSKGNQYTATIRNETTIPANSYFDMRIQGTSASIYYYEIIPLGTFVSKFGSFGTGDGQFDLNLGLSLLGLDLFSTSRNRGDIQKFDLQGNFVSKFGNNAFNKITSDGINLFATGGGDFAGTTQVEVFDISGNQLNTFGSAGTGDGQFTYPFGITYFSNYIYVGDFQNTRIQYFDTNGNFINKFGSTGTGDGQFQQITGIANNGINLFVCDSGRNDIQIFDADGTFVGKFGSAGTGDGQFQSVSDVCVYNNKLIVVDQGRQDVQVFEYDGTFVSKFGSAGTGNGQFQTPISLGCNETNIYILDYSRADCQIFK